jgi:hypothetical protein
MPTEDHSSDRSHQGLPQGGVDLSLDKLAKGLATGTLSRGKALRLMGAALVGGALASIPGIALAKPKPEGAKCKQDKQCASGNCSSSGTCGPCVSGGGACTADGQCCSGLCRPDRFGGGFCAAVPPICTPSCPAGCSCEFTPDGATTCISCPGELCALRGPVTSCGECCVDESCTPLEVCTREPILGTLFCAPACPAPV